jgi:hypothetical protein
MGKSTFARLLVNALLNIAPCVAFLDTDLGQPEFTPSGDTTSFPLPVVLGFVSLTFSTAGVLSLNYATCMSCLIRMSLLHGMVSTLSCSPHLEGTQSAPFRPRLGCP